MVRRFLVLVDNIEILQESDYSTSIHQLDSFKSHICALFTSIITLMKEFGDNTQVALVSTFRIENLETKWYGSEIQHLFQDLTAQSIIQALRFQDSCSVSTQLNELLTKQITETSTLFDVYWLTSGSFDPHQLGESEDVADTRYHLRSISKRQGGSVRLLYDSESEILDNVQYWKNRLKGSIVALRRDELEIGQDTIAFSKAVTDDLFPKDILSRISLSFLPRALPEYLQSLGNYICYLTLPSQNRRPSVKSTSFSSFQLFVLKKLSFPIHPLQFDGTHVIIKAQPGPIFFSSTNQFLDRVRICGEEYLCYQATEASGYVQKKKQFVCLRKSPHHQDEVVLSFIRVEGDPLLHHLLDCEFLLDADAFASKSSLMASPASDLLKRSKAYLLDCIQYESAPPSQSEISCHHTKGQEIARFHKIQKSCPKKSFDFKAVVKQDSLLDYSATIEGLQILHSQEQRSLDLLSQASISSHTLEERLKLLVSRSKRSHLQDFWEEWDTSNNNSVSSFPFQVKENGTLFSSCDFGLVTAAGKRQRLSNIDSSSICLETGRGASLSSISRCKLLKSRKHDNGSHQSVKSILSTKSEIRISSSHHDPLAVPNEKIRIERPFGTSKFVNDGDQGGDELSNSGQASATLAESPNSGSLLLDHCSESQKRALFLQLCQHYGASTSV